MDRLLIRDIVDKGISKIDYFVKEIPIDGEIRLTRKRWPRNASYVVVNIVYEGPVFTVATASISIGLDGKPKAFYTAEGISRLSPSDEERRNPTVGRERAIQQAIRALYTRVMKHRRSLHHYRG